MSIFIDSSAAFGKNGFLQHLPKPGQLMRLFKQFCLSTLSVAFFSIALASSLFAQEINVVNHSFEDDGVGFIEMTPTGWVRGAETVWLEDKAGTGMTGSDGLEFASMAGAAGGFIYQDLGVGFLPNQTYSVEVASAHRDGYVHSRVEFGLFSSDAIGNDLGVTGWSDVQGVWEFSGNPDADNLLNLFRDSAELAAIGNGNLAQTYSFTTGDTPPSGNIVVFVRQDGTGVRTHFDNVRVFGKTPPGGEPTLEVVTGRLSSGGLSELAASDNLDLSIRRSPTDIQSMTGFVYKDFSPLANPNSIQISLEGSVFARSNVVQIVELQNYDTGLWEQIDSELAARFVDSIFVVNASGDLSRFIEDSTNCIEVRVRYSSANPRQQFTSNTDHLVLTID